MKWASVLERCQPFPASFTKADKDFLIAQEVKPMGMLLFDQMAAATNNPDLSKMTRAWRLQCYGQVEAARKIWPDPLPQTYKELLALAEANAKPAAPKPAAPKPALSPAPAKKTP